MATVHISSRPRPAPQLPPLRAFALYPSHVANMALTSLDTMTVTTSPAGTAACSKTIDFNKSLPQPPAAAPRAVPQHRAPSYPSQYAAHPVQPQRQSSDLVETAPAIRVQRAYAYQPMSHFFSRAGALSLQRTMEQPNVLQAMLSFLEWREAYTLFLTCKKMHDLVQESSLRDVVLARFLPGYAYCLRNRDMQYFQDIPITVHDLDLLLISQRVPLHRYPIHALKLLSSLYPTLEDDQVREKLAALTHAHSRFVLLLQSLAHSSAAAMPQEAEEGSYRPRFTPIQTLRELTFPPPLSYSEPPAPPPKGVTAGLRPSASKLLKHSRNQSAPCSPVGSLVRRDNGTMRGGLPLGPSNRPLSPRPSADATSSMISSKDQRPKKGRKLSLFGRKTQLPPSPPPPDEPRALKIYSSTWRKSSYYGPFGDVQEAPTFFGGGSRGSVRMTQQQQQQQRPHTATGPVHRRFASFNDSSDSASSMISRSRNSTSNFASSNGPGYGGGAGVLNPEARSDSPHDLIMATSRVRAPILRLFVPCTRLDADSQSIIQCEQQLVHWGLWDHLSTGDIICNLGYVPPLEDGNSSDGDDPAAALNGAGGGGEFIMMRPGPHTAPGSSGADRKWLLFNGQCLVPYSPPDLLPLHQPLHLPTPFYYTHIMPHSTNLSYVITQLPVCDDVPQVTLVYGTRKVRSPHSPSGYAMVKKYSWIARIVRLRNEADGEMGEGWFGEWVLEGEGTSEGKQLLLDALKGHNLGHREWELVREKSGGGKLWLRLLTIC